MNPVGANAWIWTSPLDDGGLGQLAPHVRELGFDLIELPLEHPGQWDADRARELLAELGLGASLCCVMPPGRDLAMADAEVVHATQEYLRHCVEVAATVGSPVVAGPMYAAVGRVWRLDAGERAAVIARVAEALRPVAAEAGERGVRLAVEPLNRYETSLFNTVEQALELVGAVDSAACGLLLDSYHMNIEEKQPADAVRAAGAALAHFHACGTDRGAPGADSFDWTAVAAALDEVGYEGALCIESFTAENEAIATAASIWRPLGASQDAIAVDGLHFLRALLGARDERGR